MADRISRIMPLRPQKVSCGNPIRGWGFMSPAEKARAKARVGKARDLAKDTGRADLKLRKF